MIVSHKILKRDCALYLFYDSVFVGPTFKKKLTRAIGRSFRNHL